MRVNSSSSLKKSAVRIAVAALLASTVAGCSSDATRFGGLFSNQDNSDDCVDPAAAGPWCLWTCSGSDGKCRQHGQHGLSVARRGHGASLSAGKRGAHLSGCRTNITGTLRRPPRSPSSAYRSRLQRQLRWRPPVIRRIARSAVAADAGPGSAADRRRGSAGTRQCRQSDHGLHRRQRLVHDQCTEGDVAPRRDGSHTVGPVRCARA